MSATPMAAAANNTPGIGVIWAQTQDGVIGKDNSMPWHVPEDSRHFAAVTSGHPVIMGRRTWDSLPPRYRPLPGRTNIVVTRRQDWAEEGAVVAHTLDEATTLAGQAPGGERAWIVGGGQLYAEALPLADVAVVTVLDLETDGDAHAPELGPEWGFDAVEPADGGWLESAQGVRYRFVLFRRGASPSSKDSQAALA